MRLKDYPQAIANKQRELLQLNHEIRHHSQSVAFFAAAIDRHIAFDSEYKNDAQRKARRNELMEKDPDYIAASQALQEATDRRDAVQVEFDFLNNQFGVMKLEIRQAIATLENAA